MKRVSLFSVLIVIVLALAGCSVMMPFDVIDTEQPGINLPEMDKSYYNDLSYQEGLILVRPKSMDKLDEILADIGSSEIKRWEGIEWAQITVPAEETVLSFMEKINQREDILFSEPVLQYEVPPFTVEEDPRIGDPPSYRVLDIHNEIEAEYYDSLWGMRQINVEPVWENITTGTQNVIVAIVDTGVKIDHEEFTGINFVGAFDATTGGDDVTDYNGHGTHVMGTAVSDGRSGKLAGVAWDTSVMPVKAMDMEGLIWTSYLVDAMKYIGDYARDNDVSIVVNMSIGGRGYSLAFKDAIDYAAGEGVLLVTSAGNAYKRVLSYPGAYNGVLSVGATDPKGEKAEFSTEGWWNSVAAPGEKILSAYIGFSDEGIIDDYAFLQGTSMAAPHVTGAVALLLSHLGPMDPVEIITRVQMTAAGDHFTEQFGYGILDVYALLTGVVEQKYGSLHVSSDVVYGLITVFDEGGNMVYFGATGEDKTHHFHAVYPGEYEVTLSYNYQIRDRATVEVIIGEETQVNLIAFPEN